MGLNGSAIITLTDVNTNSIEVIKEDNLVTNALNKLFSGDFGVFGMRDICDRDIFKEYIGGILLFKDRLIEDPNEIYAQYTNDCVGYAAVTAPSTNPIIPKRGKINLEDTKVLPNGIQLAFDFATNEANGTISSIALTSDKGGNQGFGDATSSYDNSRDECVSYQYRRYFYINTARSPLHNIYNIDTDNNYIYTANVKDGNIVIEKNYTQLSSTSISTIRGVSKLVETLATIPIPEGTSNAYSVVCNGPNNILYVLFHNINNTGIINYIKISKTDYTFTKGTWTLPGVTIYDICINGNFLYAIDDPNKRIVKMLLDTPNTVTYIATTTGSSWIQSVNGTIYTSIGNIRNDIFTAHYTDQSKCPIELPLDGMFEYNDGRHIYLYICPQYLATINNLATPIVKTSDKTMKIVYTLTETPTTP